MGIEGSGRWWRNEMVRRVGRELASERRNPEDPHGRGIEAARGLGIEGETDPILAAQQRDDARIKAAFTNRESCDTLFHTEPINFVKGAIGLRTERGASQISDHELLVLYVEGGRFEWDPVIANYVAIHLRRQGFKWTP